MKTFLVIGAGGRIGRAMIARAAEIPAVAAQTTFQIRAPRSADQTAPPRENVVYTPRVPAPVVPDALVDLMAQSDVVLNLAGKTPTNPGAASDADYAAANVDYAERLIEVAAAQGVSRVLLASSASVYGRPAEPDVPIREDVALAPLSDYAQSKTEMEQTANSLAEKFPHLGITCLRIATIAGADALLQNAFRAGSDAPLLLDQFANGKGPQRSYIGLGKLADVLFDLSVSDRDLPATLNVANNQPVRMEDLLEQVKTYRPGFAWRYRPAPEGAIETVVFDTGCLDALLPDHAKSQSPRELVADAARQFEVSPDA